MGVLFRLWKNHFTQIQCTPGHSVFNGRGVALFTFPPPRYGATSAPIISTGLGLPLYLKPSLLGRRIPPVVYRRRRGLVTSTAVFLFFLPVVSVVFARIFLFESLNSIFLVGAVFVLIGVFLAS